MEGLIGSVSFRPWLSSVPSCVPIYLTQHLSAKVLTQGVWTEDPQTAWPLLTTFALLASKGLSYQFGRVGDCGKGPTWVSSYLHSEVYLCRVACNTAQAGLELAMLRKMTLNF